MADAGQADRVRRRAAVSGRVQGVFFRASTVDEARRLGLAGSVRNADDGTVHVDAEGRGEDVAALLAWLHDGPPHARVADVVVTEAVPTGAQGFTQT